MTEQKSKYKIWRASTDSKAGFMVTPDMAVMAGDDKHFIAVDRTGTSIAGPVSFITTSEQIRQGGMFVQMPDFVRMIPPTIVTPIPSQIPFPPVAIFASVALSMPFLLAMVI